MDALFDKISDELEILNKTSTKLLKKSNASDMKILSNLNKNASNMGILADDKLRKIFINNFSLLTESLKPSSVIKLINNTSSITALPMNKTDESNLNKNASNMGILADDKLRKIFINNFSLLTESLKPSSVIKLINKTDESDSINTINSKLSKIEKSISFTLKNSFKKEAVEDKKMQLQENIVDALEDIADNTNEISDSDGNNKRPLTDALKDPKGMLHNVIKKVGITGLVTGLMSKSKYLTKFLFKGLGKLALPVALLFGAKDFIKGMKRVQEIAGSDNLVDALAVGLSEVLSGLTFGLLSTKNIYKGLDYLKDQIIQILRTPFVMLNDILKGEKSLTVILKDGISTVLSSITLGAFSKKKLQKGIGFLIESIKNIFTAPLNLIKNIFTSDIPISQIIQNYINEQIAGLTFGLFSDETINESVKYLVDKIKFLFFHPIKAIESVFNEYMNFLDLPEVDISGFIDMQIQNVREYLTKIRDYILNFKDRIFDEIKNVFNDSLEFIGLGSNKESDKLPSDSARFKIQNNKQDLFDDTVVTNKTNNKIAKKYRSLEKIKEKQEIQKNQDNITNLTNVVNNNIIQNNRSTSVGFNSTVPSLF